MRRFNGPTRYLGDQSANLARFRDTAESYPRELTPDEARGLRQKPFDWSPGHPSFFNGMYQALNAIQALRLSPGARVVEVGSGAGWITQLLAGLAYRVECIEPSVTMIEAAHYNVAGFLWLHGMDDFWPNVRFHHTTLEECDLPAGIADGLLFYESFHHLVDERTAARQAFRLLKPGGSLCISGESNWIPGSAEQATCWDAEMKRFGTLESPFTHKYLIDVLASAGFTEIVRHHGINGWFPVSQERAHIGDVCQYPARFLNNVTARRP